MKCNGAPAVSVGLGSSGIGIHRFAVPVLAAVSTTFVACRFIYFGAFVPSDARCRSNLTHGTEQVDWSAGCVGGLGIVRHRSLRPTRNASRAHDFHRVPSGGDKRLRSCLGKARDILLACLRISRELRLAYLSRPRFTPPCSRRTIPGPPLS